MRVRQDGDSRGVGEPPRLSVQVLRLPPPMFTLASDLCLCTQFKRKNNICAVLGSPERVSKTEDGIPIAGGGGAKRAAGSSLFHLAREFCGLASQRPLGLRFGLCLGWCLCAFRSPVYCGTLALGGNALAVEVRGPKGELGLPCVGREGSAGPPRMRSYSVG